MRPIRATVSLEALRHNLALARGRAPHSQVWAVVKANAYGHGLARAVAALDAADGFALLELDAAIRLRQSGIKKPLLMLEGFFDPEELIEFSANRLTAAVHDLEQVRMLEKARAGPPFPVYLKINTGMNRLGIRDVHARQALERLRACAAVESITLMTHFADADAGAGADVAAGVSAQVARLDAIFDPALPRSLANSAALLRHPRTHAGWVRPGIMLYGCSPFADQSAEAIGLKPVMTLQSRIIAVQELQQGDRVGYSGTFVALAAMRIGVVACGYADGYPRHAPGGTPVLVAGRRTASVGRVSMDMLAVDLTTLPQTGVGDDVTLWGEGLPADEVARAAGTVSYELLCALAPRVPVIEKP